MEDSGGMVCLLIDGVMASAIAPTIFVKNAIIWSQKYLGKRRLRTAAYSKIYVAECASAVFVPPRLPLFFFIITPPVVLLLIEPATWIVIESCAANVPPYPPGNQPQEPYTKREKQKAR